MHVPLLASNSVHGHGTKDGAQGVPCTVCCHDHEHLYLDWGTKVRLEKCAREGIGIAHSLHVGW